MRTFRWIVLASLASTIVGCSLAPPGCPTKLKAVVGRPSDALLDALGLAKDGLSGGPSSIQWGRDHIVVSANITTIKVDCYPVQDQPENRNARGYSYTVAITANLTRTIVDSVRFELTAGIGSYKDAVNFQLLTGDGVILEEAKEIADVAKGDNEFDLSTKFEGLTLEEMNRARGVRAFWTYGR